MAIDFCFAGFSIKWWSLDKNEIKFKQKSHEKKTVKIISNN